MLNPTQTDKAESIITKLSDFEDRVFMRTLLSIDEIVDDTTSDHRSLHKNNSQSQRNKATTRERALSYQLHDDVMVSNGFAMLVEANPNDKEVKQEYIFALKRMKTQIDIYLEREESI